MPGFLSVAALLLVAGEIDVNAYVSSEARGGQAPLVSGRPPRAGVVGVLTPGVSLELLRPELELHLDYGPRLFWRQPNESGACPTTMPGCESSMRSSRIDPLVLHTVNLTALARPARTVRLNGAASGSVGEADYSALAPLLGPTPQVTLPTVIEILSAYARAGVMVNASRLWELGVSAEVAHRRPLGVSAAPTDPTVTPILLPRQTTVRADPTAAAHLTTQDDLLLVGGVSYETYSQVVGSQPEYLTLTAQAGWRAHLNRRYDLRLVAGAAYLKSLGTLGTMSAPSPFSPVGEAEFHGRLLRGDDLALNVSLGARVDYFINPILALAAPQGTLLARCYLLFGQDWMAAVEGAFGTSLTSKPFPVGPGLVPGMNGVMSFDETVASLSVPVRHRLSDHLVVEFGGRWSDRAPHFAAADFRFHQRQLWAYVSLTATTRDLFKWISPESASADARRPSRLSSPPGAFATPASPPAPPAVAGPGAVTGPAAVTGPVAAPDDRAGGSP